MENKIKRPRFIQMEKNENDNMMMVDSTDQLLDSNNNNSDKQKSTILRKTVSTWEEFF